MSSADRPWWATEDDDPRGSGTDPLDAHRAARRGDHRSTGAGARPDPDDGPDPGVPPTGERTDDDGSWWVPATEALTRLARDLAASAVASPPRGLVDDDTDGTPRTHAPPPRGGEDEDGASAGGHHVDACGVCPICVGLRALGASRPELAGHLAEAARQLTLAVRTVVDAAAARDGAGDPPRSQGPGRRPPEDLRRIHLDD